MPCRSLRFLNLHATHATLLRHYALHAMPILTFLELAHTTHATLLRHYALHAMPILTFLELAHATHATLLRHYALHAMPILTFPELARATHATLLRHYALHAMPILTFLELALAHSTHAMLVRAQWNKSAQGGTVSEKIFTYLYAWVWRYHLPAKAKFKVEPAKICWQSSLPAAPKKRLQTAHAKAP